MLKSNLHTSVVNKPIFFFMLTLILVSLYYVLLVLNFSKTTTIEFEFIAEKSGTMAVFWPLAGNTYDESQQKIKRFSAGLNKYQINVPYYPAGLSLRLDPDNKKNKLQIKQLSFMRAGGSVVLKPEDIAGHIVAASAVKWHLSSDGLNMVLQSNDPMLIIKSLPFTMNTAFWLLPLLTFLALASLLLCLLLLRFQLREILPP